MAGDGVTPVAPGGTTPGPGISTATAAPSGGSSWLAPTAVGLSGVAVLLAATALAVALSTRSRAKTPPRPVAPEPDPRTAERLQRLEAQVRGLEAAAIRPATASAPAPGPVPTAAPRAPFPPPAPAPAPAPAAASADAPSARAAAPPSAVEAASPFDLAAWTAELTEAFARLARDPSAAAAGFIARHRPQGAAAGPDGLALVDGFEGAKLWAVRAPVEGEVWALTPGEVAVMNWSAHFASQRAQVAAEVFGAAFDLAEGGEALRLEAPAMLRRDPASGRLSVRRRGRLSGFRS